MDQDSADTQPVLGFLTVVEREPHGLFGGYLLLNLAGRPLEFHCTAPLKPNRAQQILYGPTLEPFLYGEHIGRALVEKSGLVPLLICTDRPPALAVRRFVDCPVALVSPSDSSALPLAEDIQLRIDSAHGRSGGLLDVSHRRIHLQIKAERQEDEAAIRQRLATLDDGFDLSEPFTRIREAIDEAQRAGAR